MFHEVGREAGIEYIVALGSNPQVLPLARLGLTQGFSLLGYLLRSLVAGVARLFRRRRVRPAAKHRGRSGARSSRFQPPRWATRQSKRKKSQPAKAASPRGNASTRPPRSSPRGMPEHPKGAKPVSRGRSRPTAPRSAKPSTRGRSQSLRKPPRSPSGDEP